MVFSRNGEECVDLINMQKVALTVLGNTLGWEIWGERRTENDANIFGLDNRVDANTGATG